MEETVLCSYWNRYSGYRFAFPAHNASTKTTICRLTEFFIHCHGTRFIAKEVQQWGHAHRIHQSYHVLPHLKPLAWYNGGVAFWRLLQSQLSVSTLQDWGKVLQKAVCAPKQWPMYILWCPLTHCQTVSKHNAVRKLLRLWWKPRNGPSTFSSLSSV